MYSSTFTFMNNRLQQFLELENITPARLADTLGVQRSGLSHILSGRNKPGYEFLTKLLHKFPHINSEWLLMGKGKPYKDMTGENGSSSSLPSSGNSRFGNKEFPMANSGYPSQQPQQMYDSILSNSLLSNGVPYNVLQSDDILYNNLQYDRVQYGDSTVFDGFGQNSPEGTNSPNTENTTYNTDNLNNTPQNQASQPSENCVNRQTRTTGGKNRQIRRVIVFYSDGSFEELFPHIR